VPDLTQMWSMGWRMARSGSAVGGKDELLPLPQILRFISYYRRYFYLLLIFSALCWNSLTVIMLGQLSLDEDLMMSTTYQCSAGSSVGAIACLCPLRKSRSGPPSSPRLLSTSGSLPPASSITIPKRMMGTTRERRKVRSLRCERALCCF
jgi:hypothetical protein